jgi:DNA-binding LacI/PurR family transcriptional regulator
MTESDRRSGARRPSTLHDVAERVGVSARTVSRVVNDEGGFSETTRRRVLDAVADLAYRPNVHARQLISGRSGSIGFLAPTLSDPFFPELAEGVQRAARAAGLMVLLSMSNGDGATQTDVLTELEGHHLQGVVVFPVGPLDELVPFLDRGMRMVTVDTVVDHPNAAAVLADLEGGTRSAVDHLVRRGCRHLAMISHGDEPTDRRRRANAFLEALPDDVEHTVLDVDATMAGGRRAAETIIELHPDVDGVFTYNDMMAIGAMQVLQTAGRSIPDDIAIIGCDDIQVAAGVLPPLSTIRIDPILLGGEAVQLLHELEAGARPRGPRRLPARLVLRQSA